MVAMENGRGPPGRRPARAVPSVPRGAVAPRIPEWRIHHGWDG